MTEVTTVDLNTFLLAFSVVWGAIAAYLIFLHLQGRKLAAAVERLEKRR